MARFRTGPTPAELSLLLLLVDGPAHPYALDARIRSEGAIADMGFSSIYAALNRLEKRGLVASRPNPGERGTARRVYELTESGREELKMAARDALARPLLGPHPNDLGVACLLLLSKSEALSAIESARRTVQEARRRKPSVGASGRSEYPEEALRQHRSLLLAAEDRFYAALERMVEDSHPESVRRRRVGS